MKSNSPQSWRPDPRFLLRGVVIVFGLGVLVALLTQLGAGQIHPVDLALSGLASVLIFLIIGGALALLIDRVRELTGLRKALVLTAVFFFAGALAWLVLQGARILLQSVPVPTWGQVAINIAITGLLSILFGSGFYFYEVMRQRVIASTNRLKEAEFAERELALARSIQERLLPPTELSGEGYNLAARHLPARFVAGDFFDVLTLPEGAVGLVVADVAGKGVGASLVMASVKAMLPLLDTAGDVERTLPALNEKLCDDLERRQFVALAYARYEPATGRLLLANAGLPDPYVLRPDTAPEPCTVDGPRMPLGLKRGLEYRTSQTILNPGDGLLLFTDGLPEATDPKGEPLGYDRLAELLPNLGPTPSAWLDELFDRIQRATALDPSDDWTALLLRRDT